MKGLSGCRQVMEEILGCRHWYGRVQSAGIGMEGFSLPALEWKGSGYQHGNGRARAAGPGMASDCQHWNGRVLATSMGMEGLGLLAQVWLLTASIGMEGFWLPAWEWKGSGCWPRYGF